jgi:rod shape-determining protein MreD
MQMEQDSPSMARLLFGLLLVLTALVQATILPRLNPLPVAPDLVLVFLFVWSGSRSLRESLFWVFFTGLLLDVLAVDYFGTNALALGGVVVLAGLARQRVLAANVLLPVILVALTTLVHGYVLGALRGDLPSGGTVPIQALVHAVLVPFIYLALRVFGR